MNCKITISNAPNREGIIFSLQRLLDHVKFGSKRTESYMGNRWVDEMTVEGGGDFEALWCCQIEDQFETIVCRNHDDEEVGCAVGDSRGYWKNVDLKEAAAIAVDGGVIRMVTREHFRESN